VATGGCLSVIKAKRVCQYVGQDKEIAEDAAKDVRKEIRTGKFNVEALKASRIAKEEEPAKPKIPTLKEYYARFEREHLRIAVGDNTRFRTRRATRPIVSPSNITRSFRKPVVAQPP
jgi:hypothetical protein